MILTMTKYHENLLSDSPLSLLFIAKFFSSLETKMVLKTLNKTFLRITLYMHQLGAWTYSKGGIYRWGREHWWQLMMLSRGSLKVDFIYEFHLAKSKWR